MQINLHQTHHEIADFEGIFNYLTQSFHNNETSGIHIFPELFLTGYPLQDLVLKKTFIDEYKALRKNYTSQEWLNIIFSTIGYNADTLTPFEKYSLLI